MLVDSALPLASLSDSARHLLGPASLRGAANGCYALAQPRRGAETYAGIARAAATHWERDSTGTIAFTLYASPDARHTVLAVVMGDSLRGTGASSGAGVAEVHYPNDTIVAVRVGPPNIAPCVEASAREWRRIQQLFQTASQSVQVDTPTFYGIVLGPSTRTPPGCYSPHVPGAGMLVPRAVVELGIWESTPAAYRDSVAKHPRPDFGDPRFRVVARTVTDSAGRFRFGRLERAHYYAFRVTPPPDVSALPTYGVSLFGLSRGPDTDVRLCLDPRVS